MKLNVLFLSLLDFTSLKESNIYTDLLSEFVKNGHHVSIISPIEKRNNGEEKIIYESDNCNILKLKIGNIQKTNLIEKGISTITVENKFLRGIKKYYSNIKFDLVLYSTPPITFQKVVYYVKKRDNAKSYLLLKDIFPQNAVDLNKFSAKGPIYQYFRLKEKKLYQDSDYIGTMSEGNSTFLLKHNGFINEDIVEVNPNSIKIDLPNRIPESEKEKIRSKYGIDRNKLLLLYGGNLGAPQGINFLLEIIDRLETENDVSLLIIGSGTEYKNIKQHLNDGNLMNTKLHSYIPKDEYIQIEQCADVGLVFLDSRFTIPNIPSRMLGYLQAGLPILAATDANTDFKNIIVDNEFGKWSLHGDLDAFFNNIGAIKEQRIQSKMAQNGITYLKEQCDVASSYKKIMAHFN
ncbi:glycosyltransferase family 4 protein [Enterococcus avium]|uniref:glycosyltransferase family 4 protein n=1 Tax=Enterococcus avium TaxID=33945 RepID=UPI003D0E0476